MASLFGPVYLVDLRALPRDDMGDGTRSPSLIVNKGLDPRIFAGAVAAIGAVFVLAGAVLLMRARRTSRT